MTFRYTVSPVGSRTLRGMNMENQTATQPTVGYFIAGAFDQPMASVEIHGDEWCVLGNTRVSDLIDNALVYGERQVFGFPLPK
jgi:hypothetical protein